MDKGHGSLVWAELVTTDVPAARTFYCAVAGWKGETLAQPGKPYTLLKSAGQQVAGLTTFPPDMPAAVRLPQWRAWFAVSDVDASARQAQQLGGRLLRAGDDIPGIGRFAVIADPEGAPLQLFRAAQPGQSATASAARGGIGWIERTARDRRTLWSFYAALFGWTLASTSIDDDAVRAHPLAMPGNGHGALIDEPTAPRPGGWLLHVNVPDLDAAMAQVVAGGGQLLQQPHPVSAERWAVAFHDPQGATFALLGPPATTTGR